jgi:hypothetical protein
MDQAEWFAQLERFADKVHPMYALVTDPEVVYSDDREKCGCPGCIIRRQIAEYKKNPQSGSFSL